MLYHQLARIVCLLLLLLPTVQQQRGQRQAVLLLKMNRSGSTNLVDKLSQLNRCCISVKELGHHLQQRLHTKDEQWKRLTQPQHSDRFYRELERLFTTEPCENKGGDVNTTGADISQRRFVVVSLTFPPVGYNDFVVAPYTKLAEIVQRLNVTVLVHYRPNIVHQGFSVWRGLQMKHNRSRSQCDSPFHQERCTQQARSQPISIEGPREMEQIYQSCRSAQERSLELIGTASELLNGRSLHISTYQQVVSPESFLPGALKVALHLSDLEVSEARSRFVNAFPSYERYRPSCYLSDEISNFEELKNFLRVKDPRLAALLEAKRYPDCK